MNIDSLRKRYLYKLISSLIGFGISIIIQAMVSRGLGPKSFGDYSFLTSIFTQIVLFFDFGNTSGYYVKLSQRPKESGIVSFYIYFTTVALGVFLVLFYILSLNDSFYSKVFPEQESLFITTAVFFAILSRYLQILNNTIDAFGYTVKSEKALIAQKIISVVFISALFFTSQLTIGTYFLFQYVITFLLCCFFVWLLRKNGFLTLSYWRTTIEQIKVYFQEFYRYSHPLFIGFLFTSVSLFLDRWLLQYFSGSIEQGFYGLSYQISSVSTLFTGAMSMLIMREFSIAFSKKDFGEMAYIFRRFIPLLYALTAYISCFTALQSDKLISIMGGEAYDGAATAVFIMCFYPIHQTYGQLSGSVLLATGETKKYAVLSIISVIIGVPLLYFLLAPLTKWGLNLGGAGLAIKMVLIQIIFVNIQLYYNSKLLHLRFLKYLAHQLFSVIIMLLISFLVKVVVDKFFVSDNKQNIINFFLSGFIYTLIVAAAVYVKPAIFGVNSADIDFIKNKLRLNR